MICTAGHVFAPCSAAVVQQHLPEKRAMECCRLQCMLTMQLFLACIGIEGTIRAENSRALT